MQDAPYSSRSLQFCEPGAGLLPDVCLGVGGCRGRLGHLRLAVRQLWCHVLSHVEEGDTAAAGHGYSAEPSSSPAHLTGQHATAALDGPCMLRVTGSQQLHVLGLHAGDSCVYLH